MLGGKKTLSLAGVSALLRLIQLSIYAEHGMQRYSESFSDIYPFPDIGFCSSS